MRLLSYAPIDGSLTFLASFTRAALLEQRLLCWQSLSRSQGRTLFRYAFIVI